VLGEGSEDALKISRKGLSRVLIGNAKGILKKLIKELFFRIRLENYPCLPKSDFCAEDITVGRFRERQGDLTLIIDHLLKLVNEESNEQPGYKSKTISASARNLLLVLLLHSPRGEKPEPAVLDCSPRPGPNRNRTDGRLCNTSPQKNVVRAQGKGHRSELEKINTDEGVRQMKQSAVHLHRQYAHRDLGFPASQV